MRGTPAHGGPLTAAAQRAAAACPLFPLLFFLHAALVGADRMLIPRGGGCFFDHRTGFAPATFAVRFPAFLPILFRRFTLGKLRDRFLPRLNGGGTRLSPPPFLPLCTLSREAITDQDADSLRRGWRFEDGLHLQQVFLMHDHLDPDHSFF
jgi:hypothetical protein